MVYYCFFFFFNNNPQSSTTVLSILAVNNNVQIRVSSQTEFFSLPYQSAVETLSACPDVIRVNISQLLMFCWFGGGGGGLNNRGYFPLHSEAAAAIAQSHNHPISPRSELVIFVSCATLERSGVLTLFVWPSHRAFCPVLLLILQFGYCMGFKFSNLEGLPLTLPLISLSFFPLSLLHPPPLFLSLSHTHISQPQSGL